MLELTAQHLRIVERVLWREFPQAWGAHREDLYGAGCLGLVQAARSFDERNGAAFQTYAWRRVAGAMRDQARTLDHLTRGQRHRVNSGDMQDPGVPLNAIPDIAGVDQYADCVNREALRRALDECLPAREAAIVRLRYLHDWPCRDIATVLGISPSRVGQLLERALRRLRCVLQPAWLDC